MVTVTCPQCRSYWSVEEFFLPAVGDEVVCRSCKTRFTFSHAHVSSYRPPDPSGTDMLWRGMVATEGCNDPPASEAASEQPSQATPEPPPQKGPETLNFTFTGNAREYFGIWMVNTLLRVVTLGFYSPWAKVRRRRYFYGNTLLDGAQFDYLANPWAILKGWMIAGFFVGSYSFCSKTYPIAAFVIMLCIWGLFPWVLVRSRIFNCTNSTYRNIRFSFNPDYRGAYKEFLWLPLLSTLTLGALYPYVLLRQKRFLVQNTGYGTTAFSFEGKAGAFYRICAPLFVVFVVCFGSFAYLGWTAKVTKSVNPAVTFIPIVTFFLLYFLAGIHVPTRLANLTWNGTTIRDYRFTLCLRVRDITWLYLSNMVVIVCTLGMLAPWAAVRMAKYRLERFSMTGVGGLDTIAAGSGVQMGAAGEELGDLLGFDFGL